MCSKYQDRRKPGISLTYFGAFALFSPFHTIVEESWEGRAKGQKGKMAKAPGVPPTPNLPEPRHIRSYSTTPKV